MSDRQQTKQPDIIDTDVTVEMQDSTLLFQTSKLTSIVDLYTPVIIQSDTLQDITNSVTISHSNSQVTTSGLLDIKRIMSSIGVVHTVMHVSRTLTSSTTLGPYTVITPLEPEMGITRSSLVSYTTLRTIWLSVVYTEDRKINNSSVKTIKPVIIAHQSSEHVNATDQGSISTNNATTVRPQDIYVVNMLQDVFNNKYVSF